MGSYSVIPQWSALIALAWRAAYLFEVIGCDIVDRGINGGFLQTAEAAFQSSYEALSQIVHRAYQLIGHGLVQPTHDQLLDLLDAGLDLL